MAEGPQAMRSAGGAAADLGCPPERAALPQMTLHESESRHKDVVARLQGENEHLRGHVTRLEHFLKVYQVKLHGEAVDVAAEAEAEADAAQETLTPPWLLGKATMSPLLVAYDLRVQELESQLETATVTSDTLHQRTQDLWAQNEALRGELRQSTEAQLRAAEAGGSSGVAAAGNVQEELDELNERLDVLMAENMVLVEHNATVEQELEAAKAELRDREATVEEMTRNFREASEAVRRFEAHCEELGREKAAAEELARAQAAEMGKSDLLSRELTAAAEAARAEANQALADRDAHQAALAEYRGRFEQETDALSDRITGTVERLRERDGLCAEQAEQIEQLNQKLRETSEAYDQTNVKCANMLRTMRKMERDLAGYAEYDEAVKKLVAESKEKAEECLLARDKMLMLQKRSGEEVARLVSQNRADAVRALQEQQQAVDETRARFQAVLDAREQEVRDQTQQIAQLHAELEEARGALRGAEHERDLLRRGVDARKEALTELWRELEDRVAAAEGARDQALALASQNEAQAQMAASDLEHEREEAAKRARAHEAALGARQAEVDALREQLRAADRQIEDAKFAADALEARVAELEQRRAAEAAKAGEERQRAAADAASREAELNAQLDAEIAKRRDADERRASEAAEAAEAAQNAAADLRRQLHEAQQEAGRTRARHDELNAQVTDLMQARAEAEQALHDADEHAQALQETVDDCERRLGEAALQLSAALANNQQQIRDMAKMRADVDTARLEKARVQRELESLSRRVSSSSSAAPVERPEWLKGGV